jgi:hypothetical protein
MAAAVKEVAIVEAEMAVVEVEMEVAVEAVEASKIRIRRLS